MKVELASAEIIGTDDGYYDDETQVAAFLEAEWSDFLLEGKRQSGPFLPVTPIFYETIGGLAKVWTECAGIEVVSACDIGGATGRGCHELAARFDHLKHLTLIEPAKKLATWAQQLLVESPGPASFPTVGDRRRPGTAICSRWPSLRRDLSFSIQQKQISDAAIQRPVDLAVCLNVVDRHPNPPELVEQLQKWLRPGGMLILASSMSFDTRFTPDKSMWIDDLNDLLPSKQWTSVADANVLYEIRRQKRERISYDTQVVAKTIRLPDQSPDGKSG